MVIEGGVDCCQGHTEGHDGKWRIELRSRLDKDPVALTALIDAREDHPVARKRLREGPGWDVRRVPAVLIADNLNGGGQSRGRALFIGPCEGVQLDPVAGVRGRLPAYRSNDDVVERDGALLQTLVSLRDEGGLEGAVRDGVSDEESRRSENDEKQDESCAEGHGRPSPAGLVPRRAQHVADAAHGVDEMRLDEVDFLAEVAHVGLEDAGVAAEVVAPDVIEELRPRRARDERSPAGSGAGGTPSPSSR